MGKILLSVSYETHWVSYVLHILDVKIEGKAKQKSFTSCVGLNFPTTYFMQQIELKVYAVKIRACVRQ